MLRGGSKAKLGGQPVRISSMVLLVAYAFYYRNVFSIVIYHHMPRERRCLRRDTPDHSNDIYLPSSSLIGDTDTVAWLRATRCTGTRPHRASQAAIACTASLHATPPFQATKSKALLVLSGRGAAVALVAARRGLYPCPPICARLARCHLDLDGCTRTVLARAARPSHVIGFVFCEATTMRQTGQG